jgi:hypothetical protein
MAVHIGENAKGKSVLHFIKHGTMGEAEDMQDTHGMHSMYCK